MKNKELKKAHNLILKMGHRFQQIRHPKGQTGATWAYEEAIHIARHQLMRGGTSS